MADSKVVRIEDFRAQYEQRSRERRFEEPREPRRALSPSQVSHRYVMLAHLRRYTTGELPSGRIH